MRKIVARMVACVLFLTTFQGVNIFAAEEVPFGFKTSTQILLEQGDGLQPSARDDKTQETALVQWDITGLQHHKLIYNVEAKGAPENITKRVELDFESSNGKDITFNASTYTGNATTPDDNTYTERILKNDTKSWDIGETTTSTAFTVDLEIGAQVEREKKELNFLVNNITVPLDNNTAESLAIRVKIVDNQVIVYTNGIGKGNLVDFKLFVGYPTLDMNDPTAEKQVFNGPKNYTITPTHLYEEGGTLKSKTLLEDSQSEKPGSKPGIKVSFDQMKAVNETTGKFEYITATNKKVTLLLGPEYTLDSMSEGIRLDFVPQGGKSIQVGLDPAKADEGTVKAEGNQLAVYLTQEGLESQGVLKWDVLQTSMIADGSFEYGNTGIKYWPSNKGHTYLGYSLNKTTSNQVQLNIQPYNIKAKATYSVYTTSNYDVNDGSGFSNQPQMIYEYDPNKTDNKNITAVVSPNAQSYFKIEVKIDDNVFSSQIVYYDPLAFPAIPEITQIKDIDNVYVVPHEDKEQPKAIGFDIEWKAPDNLATLLTTGDLYYELILRKDKEDKDPILRPSGVVEDEYATYSKIFRVSLKDGNPIVEPVFGTAGGDYKNTPQARYHLNTKTFTMENVVLKNFGDTDNWEQILFKKENHLDVLTGEYLLEDSLENPSDLNTLGNRSVPGTYYLSFRTVFRAKEATKSIVYSAESNIAPLSLDITKEIIPVPSNIQGEDTTPVDKSIISEEISYGYVDIQNYVKKMLEPAYKFLYSNGATKEGRFRGEYEIYLYQTPDQLNDTINKVEESLIPVRQMTTGSILDLSVAVDGKTDIDRLRDGEVVPIVVEADDLRGLGAGDFEITGLDPNQVYYLRMRVKLSPTQYDADGNELSEVEPEYSLFSKDFSFTTTTKPIPPTDDDKVPPTPEDIWVVEQPNNTTVTLGWAPADFEEDEDISKTYYEFIRTDKQLIKEDMAKDIESLVDEDENKVGFRSDSPTESEPFINTYLQGAGNWARLSPEQLSAGFNLTDDSLAPNNVYYYYVRTVCVIDGNLVKSTWIMVPVTTSPVAPPMNLKVESVKNYDHDPKEEIVISFDAPIPDGADVPDDYEFEIAVQGELDSAYSSTKYSVKELTSKQDASLTPEGYTHFVYKLYELKPNKRYDIKVRIKDKTKEIETGGQYPASLYCDKVTTRTDYDELEQEKDDKYKEYLKKFDDAVEKLRRKPYWTVKAGHIYKYRESYINTELGLQSEYQLVGEPGVTDLYYYMPASLFEKASDMNTVIKVVLGDQTINIRPNTLTSENEDIAEAIKFINSNKYQDYYVGMRFYLYDRDSSVKLENPISPEMFLDMEIVYMEQEDMLTEDDIMIELNTLIDRARLDVIEELEEELEDDDVIEEDTLEDIIADAIADIEDDHPARVKKVLDRHEDRTSSIYELEKGILVMTTVDSFSANGYYFNGSSWEQVDTYSLGNGFALEAFKLGNYIFTGQKSLVSTVPELAPYQTTISKYNLSDFFTINNYMINVGATKEQVYGAAARVLGASRGSDYTLYLKGKGIKGITNIGINKTIKQDEAIYVMMQVYEKKRSRPIASIMVQNRQGIQNIGAFQMPYRNYVYAAVELKIVDNPSNKVLPSKEMSVKEIIKMLHKIDTK